MGALACSIPVSPPTRARGPSRSGGSSGFGGGAFLRLSGPIPALFDAGRCRFAGMATLTARESGQVDAANSSGRTPVVFIHGLWLLASSWDRWAALFEQAGFAPVAPGWPDDPETVEEARVNPDVFAGKKVGQVADHVGDVIGKLDKKPVVVGHSFGALLGPIIAGR